MRRQTKWIQHFQSHWIGFLTLGGQLIQPLGGGDHSPYYASAKMSSILEVCNVLGTFEMLRWLVSLSSSSSSSCQIRY